MKNLNCVIVGYGRMGLVYHRILKDLKLRKISIISKNLNASLKNKTNFFEDFKHFTKKNYKIDLAIISTTADYHKYYLEKFANLNTKLIMVEKPISDSVDNINKMIRICKKKKIILSVNHSSRYLNSIKFIKKIIEKKKLGGLVSINAIGGNMGIAMNGVHFFEIFNYLTKKPIYKVMSQFDKKILINPRGKKFKDNSGVVIAKNKRNQFLYLNLLNKQGHGKTISFVFRNGIIYLDSINNKMFISKRFKKDLKLDTRFYSTKSALKTLNFKEDIYNSTKQSVISLLNKNNFVEAKDGLDSVKAVVASIESGRKGGKPVFIKSINKSKKFSWA